VEARLAGASALNIAVKTFMNLVNYYGQQVEIDSRAVVAAQILRTKASLDAEVTVIGMRTYVEVHNREKSEQDLPPEGLTDEPSTGDR